MDGLINLYKPAGLTSARALDRVRRATGQRKSGHAGTLDPAATGVLLICLGKGTKRVERLMDLPKVYRTTLRLDQTSPSFDADAVVSPVQVEHPPTLDEVQQAVAAIGRMTEQAPPVVSALKIGGRAAYKLARRGEVPVLAPRQVVIYWIALRRYEWPEVQLEIACGRGTYIRAIARDLGQLLRCGGCLTQLERTAVGPFTSQAAWTLDRLAEPGGADQAVLSLDELDALLSDPASRRPPADPAL